MAVSYSEGDQIIEDEIGRPWELRHSYKILVEESVGKRPSGRLGCREDYNIKMDLKQTGWEGVDCIHLAQHRDQWQTPVNLVKLQV